MSQKIISVTQLATAQQSEPSTPPPGNPTPTPPWINNVFYSSTLYNSTIPQFTTAVIAGSADGTANTAVDDEINIVVNSTNSTTTLLNYDYSNGNSGQITPIAPVDVTALLTEYKGQQVQIATTFTDLYPNFNGGTGIYLVFS